MASYKSKLDEVLQEMLARQQMYNQSPQASVNAQMSAEDPSFAAGALVGQLLGNYLGKQFQNRQDKQTLEDSNPPTQPMPDYKQQAIDKALPVDTGALQQQFLGNGNTPSFESMPQVSSPFESSLEEQLRKLRGF